jgi:hypothetical protein
VASGEEDQDPGRHWLLRYVVPLVVLALSVLWFFHDRSYESAITLVTSAAVFGGVLISRGRVAVAFIGGFVAGGVLISFVAHNAFQVVPDFAHLVSELSAKQLEISNLRRQSAELVSKFSVNELEISSLRKQNAELGSKLSRNELEVLNLRKQNAELARNFELNQALSKIDFSGILPPKQAPAGAQPQLAKKIIGVWQLKNQSTWEFTPSGTFIVNPGIDGTYRVLGEDLVELEEVGFRGVWSVVIHGDRATFVTPARLEGGLRFEMQRIFPKL